MGCGEGRIHWLISRLELLPEQSLVLLEEPELSLHASAEYELGKYLLDLVARKHHQVLLTTHSSMLLRSLPDASLIFLARCENTIKPLPGMGPLQAASLLTGGEDKALTVLVEDEAAQLVLTQLIRHHCPAFLPTIRIAIAREKRDDSRVDASGKDAIRSTMKTLSEAGLRLAAVLDGGEDEDANRSIYRLPGKTAPENELYDSPSVREMLHTKYNLNLSDLDAELADQDCHMFFKVIGRFLEAAEVLDSGSFRGAEVVTLSACETGLGMVQGAEGVLGLSWAFLAAGNRSVLASLWPVDDAATALLMGRFYQNLLGTRPGLKQGMGKAAALAEAQNWLRTLPADEARRLRKALPSAERVGRTQGEDRSVVESARPYEPPYYWAAFVLIGDPG
jgi:hypothetical protein